MENCQLCLTTSLHRTTWTMWCALICWLCHWYVTIKAWGGKLDILVHQLATSSLTTLITRQYQGWNYWATECHEIITSVYCYILLKFKRLTSLSKDSSVLKLKLQLKQHEVISIYGNQGWRNQDLFLPTWINYFTQNLPTHKTNNDSTNRKSQNLQFHFFRNYTNHFDYLSLSLNARPSE